MRSEAIPFDLRTLDIFLAVCDRGSMAGAARQMGLTQPAVSQAVAELETRTGARLFDRSVRPLGLTPAGGVLRQRASALLSEARQIAPMLRETENSRFPLLRAGLVDSLSRALAAPLGATLLREADEASVQAGLTASHAAALLTRQLDLLIGADELEEVAGLERFDVLSEPYILIAPAGTPRPEGPEDLARLAARLPFVRYSARSKTGIEVERHLRRLKLDLPRRLEFDTPQGVTAVVVRGEGFAVSTPLCGFEAGVSQAALACWPLPGPAVVRRLVLVARRQELGRLPRELATFCRSELAAHVAPVLLADMPWLGSSL
ncbi:LysR family transcriptional regulator [Aquabacter spiritensis]|uniref:DNA-binding transcriptional LysR family regulator n=1 Tax=Aquabacter spiritensis TaxID=933073 RepID=A0A4V2UXH4_9HYPH|nr:LysR family transcriptional regulator [Aquabacter spiritensis]TCT03528.1 DNA-binding transcriptional LysR family regulator [Aquabacter spiritensis]